MVILENKSNHETREGERLKEKQQNKFASEDDIGFTKEAPHMEEEARSTFKGVGPAPFLKKIFKMVEDPNTDPIVSWGKNHHSFVVWDSYKLSKDILPKYFRHNNFLSFIRQLNYYEFKKINSGYWEFAHEGFQGGKRHLLKTITRITNKKLCDKKLQDKAFKSMKSSLESEVKELKKEQRTIELEIMKLLQQNEDSKVKLTNVEEQVRCAELKQDQMLALFTKMVQWPNCVEQSIHNGKQNDGSNLVKKRKFHQTQCPESFSIKGTNTTPDDGYKQGFELNDLFFRTMATNFSPMEEDLCKSMQGLRIDDYDVSHDYDDVIEKLMGDSLAENVDVNKSNMFPLELRSWISKPVDWVGSTSGLEGQTS